MKRAHGFTMIEMTIVLVMIGILTAALAPALLRQHANTMEARDREALLAVKTSLTSYMTTFGGIPDPVSGTSAVPVVAALDVNNWGAFGDGTSNPFRLDVNDALKLTAITAAGGAASGDRVIFCQAVAQELSKLQAAMQVSGPRICTATSGNPGCAADANSTPVAFVLYSTGNDRRPNQANADPAAANTTVSRYYENDRRGINNSPGTDHYDDQMMSYPLSAAMRDCREKMAILPEVIACAPGEKYLGTVINKDPINANVYIYTFLLPDGITTSPSQTVTVNPNTLSYANTCVNDLKVRGPLIADPAVPVPLTVATDKNGDGRLDGEITTTTAAGTTTAAFTAQ